MQKVVDFLEKNVQWLVLGLAGLVFLAMVWMYVVQPPVTVQMSGKPTLPGEIDQLTVQGPVANFKRATAPGASVDIPVPEYLKEFTANAAPAELQHTVIVKLSPTVKPPLERIPDGTQQFDPVAPPSRKVTELVMAAPATFTAGNNGRSVIMMEDPKVKARRKPGEPAPATVKPADMIKEDRDWVTVGFDIDVTKLTESFNKVFGDIENLPPNIYETQIVYVELVREEKLPNGQWGNRKSVRPRAEARDRSHRESRDRPVPG
jgi:hypothetical protein